MSIQLIARELYQLFRKIEALEKEAVAATGERKAALADQLRKLRAEYRWMRGVLDGQKDDNRPKHRSDG
jgi:hypothetical protein